MANLRFLDMQRTLVVGFVSILTLLPGGCGHRAAVESNRAEASGMVTLDGKPLPTGSITFISTEDPRFRVTAMIQGDGGFKVADAPLGRVRVVIETESARGNPGYVPVPAKYADAKTSGLTAVVVKANRQPLLFELKSK
jgi:hypothetical protein